MILRARHFELTLPRPARVMGIVNVTPDSFSDGGRYFDADRAIAHGEALVAQGADLLDIGGESTRPGSLPVDETEELRRVVPVIVGLAKRVPVPLSIDTMKPAVARAALAAGAHLVNDVGANRTDPEMWRLVGETGAGYVCMHMLGSPRTMQDNPVYGDVVGEVRGFFLDRLEQMTRCGVRPEQIILDPGIGFGKTLEHNLQLLGQLNRFKDLDRPLLVGVSRKSFIGRLLGAGTDGRVPAGLACAVLALESEVALIRTHDVSETVQAVRMAEAVLANRKLDRRTEPNGV